MSKPKQTARKKQRVLQHKMEDASYQVIKGLIPQEWVVREFNKPDYGIDLVIELFELIDEDDQTAETLGEFIFVQVKSIQKLEIQTEKIYPVKNVAKGTWIEDKNEYMNLEVVKYSLDTDTLFTIQEVGASISVLLFLVDLSSSNVYFVCLNDYIDKIILPKKPEYLEQGNYTIKIPIQNNLKDEQVALTAMKFYGKRSKLLSAFSKFHYQKNEILHLFETIDYPVFTLRQELTAEYVASETQVVAQIKYFIKQLKYLDIWNIDFWDVVKFSYSELDTLETLLNEENINIEEVRNLAIVMWHRLSNLGNMYEDICREWFLPKVISLLSSYPDPPELLRATR